MKKILFLSFTALFLYTSAAALSFGKRPKSVKLVPVDEMQYGDTTRTELPFAKDPTVIRLGDRYLMYHSIAPFSTFKKPANPQYLQCGWNSAIAESQDLIHWSRVGDLDLRDSKGKRIWGAVAPCVKIFDGTIHMFYQRRWDAVKQNNIWHAISKDGITFINTHDEPIFIPECEWSLNRSIDAEVYRVGKKMILLFATREPTGKIQMLGMAEAPYGSDYGPDKWQLLSTDKPFMKPDFAWEQNCIEAPTVIKHKGLWYLFYAGAYNHELQQIGLAISKDGYNFARIKPDGLLFPNGAKGSWNESESGHPGVFRDNDGRVYLFYQGKRSKNANYLLSVCNVYFE